MVLPGFCFARTPSVFFSLFLSSSEVERVSLPISDGWIQRSWNSIDSRPIAKENGREGKRKRKKILCCGERLLFNFEFEFDLVPKRFILKNKMAIVQSPTWLTTSFIVSPPLIVDLCLLACVCASICAFVN